MNPRFQLAIATVFMLLAVSVSLIFISYYHALGLFLSPNTIITLVILFKCLQYLSVNSFLEKDSNSENSIDLQKIYHDKNKYKSF